MCHLGARQLPRGCRIFLVRYKYSGQKTRGRVGIRSIKYPTCKAPQAALQLVTLDFCQCPLSDRSKTRRVPASVRPFVTQSTVRPSPGAPAPPRAGVSRASASLVRLSGSAVDSPHRHSFVAASQSVCPAASLVLRRVSPRGRGPSVGLGPTHRAPTNHATNYSHCAARWAMPYMSMCAMRAPRPVPSATGARYPGLSGQGRAAA